MLTRQISSGSLNTIITYTCLFHNTCHFAGNPDNKNGLYVLELLKNPVQKDNVTLVMATHNIEAAMFAERIIHFKDGTILRKEKVADHESKVAMVYA